VGLRRVTGWMAGALLVVLLALPTLALGAPGDQVRSRSLHLRLSIPATRGYDVSLETAGHHRVTLTAQKNGLIAAYTVRGKVSRHRIRADFGRFGRVNLRFHGRARPFRVLPTKKILDGGKSRRCRGRKPEREVGRFRGAIEFEGDRHFTRLAVGAVRGEVRRTYRQVCRLQRNPRAHASISSSPQVVRRADLPRISLTLALLNARAHVAGALIRFSVIQVEIPPGLPVFGGLFSLIAANSHERVGRVRVHRSTFVITEGNEVEISRRGVTPAKARVAPGSPFSGSAIFRGPTDEEPASWQGDLAVRLPGVGALPLTGPGFQATLCRASVFRLDSPCFRRAQARVLAAQGSGSHSHPLALARLSSLR
jgi:hypothetical protein